MSRVVNRNEVEGCFDTVANVDRAFRDVSRSLLCVCGVHAVTSLIFDGSSK